MVEMRLGLSYKKPADHSHRYDCYIKHFQFTGIGRRVDSIITPYPNDLSCKRNFLLYDDLIFRSAFVHYIGLNLSSTFRSIDWNCYATLFSSITSLLSRILNTTVSRILSTTLLLTSPSYNSPILIQFLVSYIHYIIYRLCYKMLPL